MGSMSTLGLALILTFALLSLLALFGELFYVIFYHRSHRLFFLCWKRQTRVEPAAASPAFTAAPVHQIKPGPVQEDDDLARWRAACLGPSRVLYTIREEEEGDTPFSTPCSSPAFYTPMASPPQMV